MSSLTKIYLRGVNLSKLFEKYASENCPFLETPLYISSTDIKEKSAIVTIQQSKPEIQPYEYTLGNGKFWCLGHRVANVNGKFDYIDPTKPFRCLNCCRKRTGDLWGIPVHREKKFNVYCYHGMDSFCTPECMYRVLRQRLNNPLYAYSDTYAKEMYELWTGKSCSELKQALDPRFLKFFGGPMSWEKYHKTSTLFPEKPSCLYFFPIIEYVEQESI